MTRRLANLSLSLKISALLATVLVVVSILVVWRSERVLERALLEQIRHQAELHLKLLERDIQHAASTLEPAAVQQLLEQDFSRADLSRPYSIQGVSLYDTSGRVLAQIGKSAGGMRDMRGHHGEVVRLDTTYFGSEIAATDHLEVTDVITPLHLDGRVMGAIEMDLDVHKTLAKIARLNKDYEQENLQVVGSTTLVALLILSLFLHRSLLKPINELNVVARRIGAGDLKARSQWSGGDELGMLAESINGMAWSIDYLFDEQEQAHLQMLKSLEMALEAKDSYTASHSTRVARYAVMLGQRIGLERDELRLLKQGAIVHDLGKIGIADSILNKQGRLSDEEYEVMRGHPEMTATIMQPLRRFKGFVDIAKSHHERWDGRGYPDGLKGEEIPLLARIVAIADTWDAMTGNRVYRPGMTVDKALRILEQERDSGQWDPQLLEQFIAMVRDMQQAHHAVEADIFFAELDGLGDQPVAKSG